MLGAPDSTIAAENVSPEDLDTSIHPETSDTHAQRRPNTNNYPVLAVLFDPGKGEMFLRSNPETQWGESTTHFLLRFVPRRENVYTELELTILSTLLPHHTIREPISEGWIPISQLYNSLREEFDNGSAIYSMTPIMAGLRSLIDRLEGEGFLTVKEHVVGDSRFTGVHLNPNPAVERFLIERGSGAVSSPETISTEEQSFLDSFDGISYITAYKFFEFLEGATYDSPYGYRILIQNFMNGEMPTWAERGRVEDLFYSGERAGLLRRGETDGQFILSERGIAVAALLLKSNETGTVPASTG